MLAELISGCILALVVVATSARSSTVVWTLYPEGQGSRVQPQEIQARGQDGHQ